MPTEPRAIDHAADATDPALFALPWGQYRPNWLQSLLIGLTRATVLQRGSMRRLMSKLIVGLGRPIDITFRGLKFRIEGANNLIEYGMLTRPSYNGEELDFLLSGLGPGSVAVDIGCNIGLYAMPMAAVVGATGRVVAIDANAEMIRHLNFHAAANVQPQVTPVAMAVGDVEAQVDLKIRLDDVAIVSVEKSETGAVRMQPLAQILADARVTRVDALKIDIEGHEDDALVPFLEAADHAMLPGRVVIEFQPPDDYPGCAAVFAQRGYRLVGRTRNNSMYQRG